LILGLVQEQRKKDLFLRGLRLAFLYLFFQNRLFDLLLVGGVCGKRRGLIDKWRLILGLLQNSLLLHTTEVEIDFVSGVLQKSLIQAERLGVVRGVIAVFPKNLLAEYCLLDDFLLDLRPAEQHLQQDLELLVGVNVDQGDALDKFVHEAEHRSVALQLPLH